MSESTEVMQAPDARAPVQGGDVTSLVQFAIEQNVSVEVLERLVALQERVSDRNARSSYTEALSAVQAELSEIPKNKEAKIRTKSGASYSYHYATLDQIARVVRPALARHGFSYSWDSEVNSGVLKATCYLQHVDGHTGTATFTCPTDSKADMSGSQQVSAALTTAKRQSLVQVLGLAIAEDDTDNPMPAASASAMRPVNAGQIADLEAMIEEVGANREKMLQWLGIGSMDEMTMGGYGRVVRELEARRKAAT
jgi:hypothetical protein